MKNFIITYIGIFIILVFGIYVLLSVLKSTHKKEYGEESISQNKISKIGGITCCVIAFSLVLIAFLI